MGCSCGAFIENRRTGTFRAMRSARVNRLRGGLRQCDGGVGAAFGIGRLTIRCRRLV